MNDAPFRLRRATDRDADEIAEVYCASFRLLSFLPMLHTFDSYRWYVANRMLKEWAVTVAEDDSGIVSFLGLRGEEVRHFYTRPARIGCGAGTQLMQMAQASGVAALELWCFQANARARHFYEARGFRATRMTDGANNEERTPDVRYRWDRVANRIEAGTTSQTGSGFHHD
jgi:GNAT superfamily N-acetyltransferase